MKNYALLAALLVMVGCTSQGLVASSGASEGEKKAVEVKKGKRHKAPFTYDGSFYNPDTHRTTCRYRNVHGEYRTKDHFGRVDCPRVYL